jgi:anti-anti-sigma factor
MNIEFSSIETMTVAKIIGNLDGNTAAQAQEMLEPFFAPNAIVIFDMEQCLYVSSAGLRVLLFTAKQLAKVNGYGVFAKLTEEVKDVMEMTGFSDIFKSYDQVDVAIAAVKEEFVDK